jgi:hypothetical protein
LQVPLGFNPSSSFQHFIYHRLLPTASELDPAKRESRFHSQLELETCPHFIPNHELILIWTKNSLKLCYVEHTIYPHTPKRVCLGRKCTYAVLEVGLWVAIGWSMSASLAPGYLLQSYPIFAKSNSISQDFELRYKDPSGC